MLVWQMFTHQASCQSCFKLDPPPHPIPWNMVRNVSLRPTFLLKLFRHRACECRWPLPLSLLLTDPSLFIAEIWAQDSTGQHFNLNFEKKKKERKKKKPRNCFIHREIRKEMVGCFLWRLYIFLPPWFGGRREGIKSCNGIIWMLNCGVEELEKPCKISQESEALWQGSAAQRLPLGQESLPGWCCACRLEAVGFLPLYHAVCVWPWKMANLSGSPLSFFWK